MVNTKIIDKDNRIVMRMEPVKNELAFFHERKVLGRWKRVNFTFAQFVDNDIEKAKEYFNL